ncbi:hypothetical protein FACS1894200_03430 [Spirochaetia bacterium]|nr:hypothetical protein FACS1894200_03430 [Spirochaetia bacterium]
MPFESAPSNASDSSIISAPPVHIGIMAKERGLIRTQGHLEGLKAAKKTKK